MQERLFSIVHPFLHLTPVPIGRSFCNRFGLQQMKRMETNYDECFGNSNCCRREVGLHRVVGRRNHSHSRHVKRSKAAHGTFFASMIAACKVKRNISDPQIHSPDDTMNHACNHVGSRKERNLGCLVQVFF